MQRCTAFSAVLSAARAVFSVISGNLGTSDSTGPTPELNSRCVAASAAFMSFSETTKEILLSDDPCAMAMMFTFSRPTALKRAPRDARRAAHVFAHHGDDRDAWIHRDVLDFFVCHILREFLAESLDGALGVRRRRR